MLIAECGAHPATLRREFTRGDSEKVRPSPFGGQQMAIHMFCPRRVQPIWYSGTDLPTVRNASSNSTKRDDLADGHGMRYSRTLAGRFRRIGGLDQAWNPTFDRWLIVS